MYQKPSQPHLGVNLSGALGGRYCSFCLDLFICQACDSLMRALYRIMNNNWDFFLFLKYS